MKHITSNFVANVYSSLIARLARAHLASSCYSMGQPSHGDTYQDMSFLSAKLEARYSAQPSQVDFVNAIIVNTKPRALSS